MSASLADVSKHSEADARVLAAVTDAEPRSRFVSEVARLLSHSGQALSQDEIDHAIARLEENGEILVREHYCADPHLEGVDLRIVAPIVPRGDQDPVSACINQIEARWQEWITEYLAEHRCS